MHHAPSKPTILNLFPPFQQRGSVNDHQRTEKPCSTCTQINIDRAREKIRESQAHPFLDVYESLKFYAPG